MGWACSLPSLCAQSFITLPAPNDSSLQLKEEKSGILYVHIYLPATGLHQTAGSPSPCFLSPLIPGRISERVGRDGLQGVRVLRWEDHTRPLENGTFFHLVIQTSLRSKVFKVRHRSKLWPSVGVHPLFWGWGDAQAEGECVPDKTNSVYNSLKQTWPWGSEGRIRMGLVRRQQAEQRQWQQCADAGHQLQTMQQQGCPGHSSDRTAPNSLASRWEALYMQLSPEETSSQSKPRAIPGRGSSSGGKQAFGH